MQRNRFWAAVSKALAAVTMTLILTSVLAPGAGAATQYKVLYTFTQGADGANPELQSGYLIFDATGNLYGTQRALGRWGGRHLPVDTQSRRRLERDFASHFLHLLRRWGLSQREPDLGLSRQSLRQHLHRWPWTVQPLRASRLRSSFQADPEPGRKLDL
jgi:hypothetical protein